MKHDGRGDRPPLHIGSLTWVLIPLFQRTTGPTIPYFTLFCDTKKTALPSIMEPVSLSPTQRDQRPEARSPNVVARSTFILLYIIFLDRSDPREPQNDAKATHDAKRRMQSPLRNDRPPNRSETGLQNPPSVPSNAKDPLSSRWRIRKRIITAHKPTSNAHISCRLYTLAERVRKIISSDHSIE